MTHSPGNPAPQQGVPATPGWKAVCLVTLAVCAGAAITRWQNNFGRIEFAGYLEARTVSVNAPRSGLVQSCAVQPGDDVSIGSPLITIHDPDLEDQIEAQTQLLGQLASRHDQLLAEAELESGWRAKTLEAEICDIELRSAGFLKEQYSIELRQKMLADAITSGDVAIFGEPEKVFPTLLNGPRVSDPQRETLIRQIAEAENAVDVSSAQVQICEKQVANLKKHQSDLFPTISRKVGVDAAASNLVSAQTRLASLEQRREVLTVASPAMGKVGMCRVQPGERVESGAVIAEIFDEVRRSLIVEVPSTNVAAFNVGGVVDLEFSGGVKRRGKIINVAPTAERSNVTDADTIVRGRVEQLGQVWPSLPIGSKVRVSLKQ